MKADVEMNILDLNDNPVMRPLADVGGLALSQTPDGEVLNKQEPWLLKNVLTEALLGPTQEDASLSGQQKIIHFMLAQKINAGGEVEMTSDEVALLKARVAKMFNTLFTYRVWEAIDPASIGR